MNSFLVLGVLRRCPAFGGRFQVRGEGLKSFNVSPRTGIVGGTQKIHKREREDWNQIHRSGVRRE